MKSASQKIGIALSGGGARGIVHLGVLQALNENKIFPGVVSGSSAGAVVGSLYAYGYKPNDILDIVKTEKFQRLFRFRFGRSDFNKVDQFKKILLEAMPENNFSSLKIPCYVAVTNLNKGTCEYINSGSLIDYLIASCAIPFIFKPVKINNTAYVDGGVLNNLPIEPLQSRKLKIIGVSICPHQQVDSFRGIRDVGERIFHLTVWNNVTQRLQQCDISLEIESAFNYGIFEAKNPDKLFELGYETTCRKMQDILSKVQ